MDDRPPNRIRELRKSKSWKQKQLADAIGCSVTWISDLEIGNRQLTQFWAVKLARALDVGPGDLFPPQDGGRDLSADELNLLSLYRAADDEQREQLKRMAEILIGPSKRKVA